MSSTGPRVWVYQNVAHTPAEALEVEDTDQNWRDLLSEPEVFEDKGDSPAFCGCEFAPEADRRLLKHAIATHCFIFDVDVWRSDRPPFTLDELSALFDGFRFIAYTSSGRMSNDPRPCSSSTTSATASRYRVASALASNTRVVCASRNPCARVRHWLNSASSAVVPTPR
jgi:hypothetical protein